MPSKKWFKLIALSRMSLSHLIHSLKYAKDPLPLFRSYRGKDWTHDVRYSLHSSTVPKSVVLWKSNTSKLVLTGWCPDQYIDDYTNYSVAHTLLLKGAIFSTFPSSYILLVPHMYEYTPPHTAWKMSSFKHSASLHLYQTSYLY